MAIARKPGSKPASSPEEAAEKFISGANASQAPAPSGPSGRVLAPEESRRIPTMIRFDPALLGRVDAAAKRRGVSRSAWIQYTLSRALDEER